MREHVTIYSPRESTVWDSGLAFISTTKVNPLLGVSKWIRTKHAKKNLSMARRNDLSRRSGSVYTIVECSDNHVA